MNCVVFCLPRNALKCTRLKEIVNKGYQDLLNGKHNSSNQSYLLGDGNLKLT